MLVGVLADEHLLLSRKLHITSTVCALHHFSRVFNTVNRFDDSITIDECATLIKTFELHLTNIKTFLYDY